MKKYLGHATTLVTSGTAKDTYILFVGNTLSAFLGFVFTILVARRISVADFGIFSAASNLVMIISSVTDLGISAGIINFVSENARDAKKKAEFIKAALIIKVVTIVLASLLVFILAPLASQGLLATSDLSIAYWVAVISVGMFGLSFFPFVLRAEKRFLKSAVIDVSIGFFRVAVVLVFLFLGILTLQASLFAFALAAFGTVLVGFYYVGTAFFKAKPQVAIYKRLLGFSGWVGLNQTISAVGSKLDVQMLAYFSGAAVTGIYSISSRLAFFIVVLTSSYSSVLAPRFASFGNREIEKKYLVKTTLALLPVVVGIIFWIIIARPFILFLFGNKYLEAIGVFQALAAAMIPFILTASAVSAIIYAMKKPIYIGAFSVFQFVAIFVLNFFFIPKYQALGPTLTFGVVNTVFLIFSWAIVIRHYFLK